MTPPSTQLLVAVPAAVLGAASFGLGSALQQRVTKQVPELRTLDPRLLVVLLGKPVWTASVLAVIAGLFLQVVALAFGPLLLVQPLLVTTVLFSAVFAAGMARCRVDRQLVLGALACSGGLAAFLLLARPIGGGARLTGPVLPLAVLLAVLVVTSLVAATRFPGEIRVLLLALATGVLYGVTAALTKIVAAQFRSGGLAEPLEHGSLYVVCGLGPLAFLISQNAFQQGRLISPALAVIATADPLVGIAIGVSWLGEKVSSTPPALVGQAVAAVVLVSGIALLAHRGEHLRREAARQSRWEQATWG